MMAGGTPIVGVAVGVSVGDAVLVGKGVCVTVGEGKGDGVAVFVAVAGTGVGIITGVLVDSTNISEGKPLVSTVAVGIGDSVVVGCGVEVTNGQSVEVAASAADEPVEAPTVGVSIGVDSDSAIWVDGSFVAVVTPVGSAVAGTVIVTVGTGFTCVATRLGVSVILVGAGSVIVCCGAVAVGERFVAGMPVSNVVLACGKLNTVDGIAGGDEILRVVVGLFSNTRLAVLCRLLVATTVADRGVAKTRASVASSAVATMGVRLVAARNAVVDATAAVNVVSVTRLTD